MKPISNPNAGLSIPAIEFAWEYGAYTIEVLRTIFGGRRVAIRETGSDFYDCNWCAGDSLEHAGILVGLAQAIIDQNARPQFCSKRKPYFLDDDFKAWMNTIKFTPYVLEKKG